MTDAIQFAVFEPRTPFNGRQAKSLTYVLIRLAACALCVAGILTPLAQTAAQEERQTANEDPSADLTLKVYQVSDLVASTPGHPYEGIQLPGRAFIGRTQEGSGLDGGSGQGLFRMPSLNLSQSGGGGSMSGGGAGGMGGAMGGGGMGGMAPGGAMGGGMGGGMGMSSMGMGDMGSPQGSSGFGIGELTGAIMSSIDPNSWSQVGGNGTIVQLRGMLLISQTAGVHERIAELLDELRREGGIILQTVTIRAWWLVLDAETMPQVFGPVHDDEFGARVDGEALRKVADQLAGAAGSQPSAYQGEITCFDGQTVHIVSGRVRTLVQGAIPIVGGGEPAYQPILNAVHDGAILQVTPRTIPGTKSMVLDLASSVTRWDEPGDSIPFPAAFSIERTNVVVHQFATTLRIPLGRPVVAGGLTLQSQQPLSGEHPSPAQAGSQRLYLFIEASQSGAEREAPSKRRGGGAR